MLEGSILFDKDDPLFKVHFPGNPTVPGSIVIRELWKAIGNSSLRVKSSLNVRQFKFRKFMKPGQYSYRFEASDRGIKCTVFNNSVIYVTGVII